MKCSYRNCSNVMQPFSDITFFSLPHDRRRSIWIQCSGNQELENLPITRKRVICENHFDEKYLRRQFHRTTLRRDAIPMEYGKVEKNDEPLAIVEEYLHFGEVNENDQKSLETDNDLIIDLNTSENIQNETEAESETNAKQPESAYYTIESLSDKSNRNCLTDSDMVTRNLPSNSIPKSNIVRVISRDAFTMEEVSSEIPIKKIHSSFNASSYQSNKSRSHEMQETGYPYQVNSTGRTIQLDPNEANNEETYFALSLIGTLKRLNPRKRAIAKCNILKYLTELEIEDAELE